MYTVNVKILIGDGAGTIFRLGEQKLHEMSVGEAKINEKRLN